MAGKAVAVAASTALALPEDLKVPERAGLEQADRDSFAIPFLAILQKMSPQADEDNEAFIKGAKPGMFLDTVANQVLDPASENLQVIPVFYRRAYVEWKPREQGGGYVGEHTVEDGVHLEARRDEGRDLLPNGNQVVDTRYHYVILVREDGSLSPMVITLSSTQVKKSKRWNSDMDLQMRAKNLRATFQMKYKIDTVAESNEHGTWRGWNITRDGFVEDQEQLNAAVSFYKAISAGEVKVAHDSLAESAGQGSSSF